MERKALYAGSFDPVTNGHLNIIERAAALFDSLTVLIAVNANKNNLFDLGERLEIMKEVTGHLSNVTVETFSGLLADYVNEHRFDAYIRGLRGTTDFENELHMAQMNARLFREDTETIFLMTDPKYSFISSSLVKEVAAFGGSIEGLVPECVVSRIRSKSQEE